LHETDIDCLIDLASFRILPQIFYSEEYTFFGHSPGGTWHGGDVAMVLWLVDRPWILLCILVNFAILTFGLIKGVKRRRAMYKPVEQRDAHEA